jgi:hypothetical protein
LCAIIAIMLAALACKDPELNVGETTDTLTLVCRRGGDCGNVMHAANKLDLLLMVDNSGSMREEQVALAAELPRMLDALLTGDIDGDGEAEMAPIKDVHVGVVTSDMGLVGVSGIPLCDGAGEDGVLQDGLGGCGNDPDFLQYESDSESRENAGSELACLAGLGTAGCGFEQQLDSVLKALTPSDSEITFLDVDHGLPTDEPFLNPPTGLVAGGHGDGENDGFLRTDPSDPSLIAVLLVTDEDDCSSSDLTHFSPDNGTLPEGSQLKLQGLNTRCHYEGLANNSSLYAAERYVEGLRALRPGAEHLVLFGAIAGMPVEAVDADALADVDFSDEDSREAFYEDLLAHPDMQERIDDRGTAEVADDNLFHACQNANGKAYPARRIVEVARGFGANGIVQSICQQSFTSAIEPILQRMAASFSGACIDDSYEREDDGKIACDLMWRLPEASVEGVPESCDDASFLSAAGEGRGPRVCRLEQLASDDGVPTGDGWYYDDFSGRAELCEGNDKQAIVFTGEARPPVDVEIVLDCD